MWKDMTADEMSEFIQIIDWVHENFGSEFVAWFLELLIQIDMGFDV